MTTRELALNLIEHADAKPAKISLARAAEIISWLGSSNDLPADLSPESFMDAWNDIVRSSAYKDYWT